MILALALASTLWASAQEAGARADLAQAFQPAAVVPIDSFGDALAVDLALLGLGTGADLITTDYAINRGCVEGNPLVPRAEGRVALKIGAGAIRGAVSYWLRRTGHKTTADVLRWLGVAADLGISVNNVVCGRRQ